MQQIKIYNEAVTPSEMDAIEYTLSRKSDDQNKSEVEKA